MRSPMGRRTLRAGALAVSAAPPPLPTRSSPRMQSPIRPEKLNGVDIPYSAPVSTLRALVGSQDPRRWAAFVALGHSTDPAAVGLLLQAATADDWEVRRAACEALGFRARTDAVADRVAERLRDPVPLV